MSSKIVNVYLLLYVDDMLLISQSKSKMSKLKAILNFKFDMKDLGCAKKILDMVIERDRLKNKLKVHQFNYLQKSIDKFEMSNCKTVSIPLAYHFTLSKLQCPKSDYEVIRMENVPYAYVIGTMMYSMISTRLDLCFSIYLLSHFMSNRDKDH